MGFDWYPWNRRDYKRDTLHLSLAEDGAYRRLIDEYMEAEGPIPNSDAALARLIGVTTEEWMTVSATVREFFKPSNNKLVHKRCEEELHAQRMRNARRTQAATVAATARHQRDREIKALFADRMPIASVTDASVVRSDATRQDITKKEGEGGSLATAPNRGALRSPQANQPTAVSDELKRSVEGFRRVK